MDIRICNVCGHKNPKDKMFCEKCGNRLYNGLKMFFEILSSSRVM
jgi:uncharacterized membrane protein YvbJ